MLRPRHRGPAPAAAAMADLQGQEPPLPAPGPGVSHVLEIPPDPQQGGEWQLLVAKLQAWWASGDLQSLLWQSRRPLTLLVGLLVALAVLQVGGAVLDALGSVPLLPGLLLGGIEDRRSEVGVGLAELLTQERIEHQPLAIQGHIGPAIEARLHVEEGDRGSALPRHRYGRLHRMLRELRAVGGHQQVAIHG